MKETDGRGKTRFTPLSAATHDALWSFLLILHWNVSRRQVPGGPRETCKKRFLQHYVTNRETLQIGDVTNRGIWENDSFNIMYIISEAINHSFNNALPLKKISTMHLQVFQRY